MSMRTMMASQMFGIRFSVVALTCLVFLALGAPSASATPITFTLTVPNTAMSGFPSPFVQVTISDLSGQSATVTATTTFSGVGQAGYVMGDGGTFALNVNASSFSVAGITWVGGNGTTNITQGAGGQVDGFGNFNLVLDNFDGFTRAVTSLTFTLTNTSSTAWTSNVDVLIANLGGSTAASHIFVSGTNCGGSPCTGFVGNGSGGGGGQNTVPEPATITLTGAGLLGLVFRWKKRNAIKA